jgi:hypothetical protein
MSELYLIAHKVRGEPAFDIAIKMGDWWIIPTSGHRAYPYWHGTFMEELFHFGPYSLPEMPADLPDHYPGAKATINLDDLEID